MRNDLLAYRERLNRFNRWEKKERQKLNEVQKVDQFIVLYLLTLKMAPSRIKEARVKHLQHLVDIQTRISAPVLHQRSKAKGKGQKVKGNL